VPSEDGMRRVPWEGWGAALSLVSYRGCSRSRRYQSSQKMSAKLTIVELEACSSHRGCKVTERSTQHSATPSG